MKSKLSKICTPYSTFLSVLIISLCIILSESRAAEITIQNAPATIVKDGDSLEFNQKRIRLIGIDAPEFDQLCKDSSGNLYPCGKYTMQYLEFLIKGKTVKCISHEKDKYDRDLCTCYADGQDINAAMIKAGMAVIYMDSPYFSEQISAKFKKSGIWNGKFMHPRLYRITKNHQKKDKKSN